MFTPKGKFGWYELMTSDTKAAGKFYSDVVGWTTQEMPGGDGPAYTTFNIDKVGIAGMLHLTGTQPGSVTLPLMMSMLISERSSKRVASFGSPPRMFPACCASQ